VLAQLVVAGLYQLFPSPPAVTILEPGCPRRRIIMQEYEREILITNQGPAAPARLKVIRLPTSWFAVIWENSERYASFSQDRTELNGGFAHLSDRDFLDRVQLVASFTQGIDFEFEEAL